MYVFNYYAVVNVNLFYFSMQSICLSRCPLNGGYFNLGISYAHGTKTHFPAQTLLDKQTYNLHIHTQTYLTNNYITPIQYTCNYSN